MDFDFAPVNFQALMKLRDISTSEPGLVCTLLDIDQEFVQIFADLSPEILSALAYVRAPLFRPRGDCKWWQRLLGALQKGDREAVTTLLECVSLRDDAGNVGA